VKLAGFTGEAHDRQHRHDRHTTWPEYLEQAVVEAGAAPKSLTHHHIELAESGRQTAVEVVYARVDEVTDSQFVGCETHEVDGDRRHVERHDRQAQSCQPERLCADSAGHVECPPRAGDGIDEIVSADECLGRLRL
jgi:hypothetical protein